MSTDTQPVRTRLPYEILVEIVKLALAIPPNPLANTPSNDRDDEDNGVESDPEIFNAKKTKLVIVHGMLMANKMMRDVVLKEWFRVLRVSVNDWEYITRHTQFDVMANARDIYCRDYGMKSVEYMSKLPSLRLEVLECRDVSILTSPLLETVANAMPNLRTLRIDCGQDGPYQPLASEGKTGVDVGEEYAEFLKPLEHLRTLSLDVSLAPTIYEEGHGDECMFNCEKCWDASKDECVANEKAASEVLAQSIPSLETLEWARWYRRPKEMKTRVRVVRKPDVRCCGDDFHFEVVPYAMYPT